jgi:hypothetical protein
MDEPPTAAPAARAAIPRQPPIPDHRLAAGPATTVAEAGGSGSEDGRDRPVAGGAQPEGKSFLNLLSSLIWLGFSLMLGTEWFLPGFGGQFDLPVFVPDLELHRTGFIFLDAWC